ncbi:MAG: PEP-CTERM sorting domain-containing protein [Phycisphaerales bacterium]
MRIAGIIAVAGLATVANAQLIDFEGLGEGTPVDTQYSGLGVDFATDRGTASISSYTSFFGSDVLANATMGGAAADRALTLIMEFSTPITELEFDFNSAGDPGSAFPIRFYNSGGLSSSDSLASAGSSWVTDINFSGLASVTRVEIDSGGGDGWLFGIDNMDFVQVPAPASLALVGLGGLVAARRRR